MPDLEHYDQERGFYYKLEETPFPIAHTNEELIHNIENFNQEKYSMQVEDFLKKKKDRWKMEKHLYVYAT